MNKNGIDDLLQVVSPELIAGYVARNFTAGSSLHAVNEEYKVARQQNATDILNLQFLVIWSAFVGLILCTYLAFWADVPFDIAFISMVAITAPAFMYSVYPVWLESKDRETRYRCEPILRDFKQAVEALNMPLTRMEEYNEISVREILISLAVLLLRAETSFKQIRMKENIPTCNVISYGETEEAWRKHFEVALSAATKFGLVFNKADLFRSAKAEITWKDEGCPM